MAFRGRRCRANETMVYTYPVAGMPANTTVYVQPSPPRFHHRRGLVGQVGYEIGVASNALANDINQGVNTGFGATAAPLHMATSPLPMFQSGNTVQLISRSTGRALEIVQAATGQLVLDGNGPIVGEAYNTEWTVVNEGSNQVRLHNNNNYLAIIGGITGLVNMPPGAVHSLDTKFQLIQIAGNQVVLESLADHRNHVGILPQNGQLKSAAATGRGVHAQFSVRLLASVYGVAH